MSIFILEINYIYLAPFITYWFGGINGKVLGSGVSLWKLTAQEWETFVKGGAHLLIYTGKYGKQNCTSLQVQGRG